MKRIVITNTSGSQIKLISHKTRQKHSRVSYMSFMNLRKYFYFNDRESGQKNFRGPDDKFLILRRRRHSVSSHAVTARLAAVPASRIQPLFHDINRVFCSPTPIASPVRRCQQRHLGQSLSSVRGCDYVRARLFTHACVCACMCVYWCV